MVRVRVSASRVCNATRDTLWNILEDLENFPQWADPTSKTHMLSLKVLKREGNSAIVEEDEIAGGYRVRHTDKFTFYPKDKVTWDVIKGPVSGGWLMTLQETKEGTRIDWSFDIKPETLGFRLLAIFRGRKIMQGIADEYCRQLAEYAEAQEKIRPPKEPIPA